MKIFFGLGIVVLAAIGIFLGLQWPRNSDQPEIVQGSIPNPTLDRILETLQSMDAKLGKLSARAEWQPAAAVVERTSVTPAIDLGEFSESIAEMKAALADFAREAQLQKTSIDLKKRYESLAEHFNSSGRSKNVQAVSDFLSFAATNYIEAQNSVKFKTQMEIAEIFGMPDEIYHKQGSNYLETWIYRFNEKSWDFEFRDGFVYN